MIEPYYAARGSRRIQGDQMRPLALAPIVLMLVGCANLLGAPASSAPPSAASLTSGCAPAARTSDVAGDVAYDLTLTNPGSQPVQVTQVAVIFYGQDGIEVGSDDPAQQDFPGDAEPIGSFNPVLIGPGQSVTVPMETGKVSGAAGGWSCQLGTWTE